MRGCLTQLLLGHGNCLLLAYMVSSAFSQTMEPSQALAGDQGQGEVLAVAPRQIKGNEVRLRTAEQQVIELRPALIGGASDGEPALSDGAAFRRPEQRPEKLLQ